jgi:hypothetical protein
VALGPQTLPRNPDGRYWLFRIGDAVASRNLHAAVLDTARLARALQAAVPALLPTAVEAFTGMSDTRLFHGTAHAF